MDFFENILYKSEEDNENFWKELDDIKLDLFCYKNSGMYVIMLNVYS
jgi:hypothetical protein